jgi:mRNA-degrading endonuclease RelE of RelBE toxin-antitoxin system
MMSEKSRGVEFSKSAFKALERLDKSVLPRILNYLESLAEAENPLRHKDVRSLEGNLRHFIGFALENTG